MAVINGKTNFIQQGVLQSVWSGIPTASTGTPEQLSRFPAHSIQLGTTADVFGATATVTVEGSDDGIAYFTLTGVGPAGGALAPVSTTTALGPTRFDVTSTLPRHIRPKVAGGDGTTSITVIITSKGFGN